MRNRDPAPDKKNEQRLLSQYDEDWERTPASVKQLRWSERLAKIEQQLVEVQAEKSTIEQINRTSNSLASSPGAKKTPKKSAAVSWV